MSTLPMRGTFGSRAKQIANQRRTADALRAVGLRNDVQGQWTQGSGGTALFGQQPEIYTMPDWSEQLLPQAQQLSADFRDRRLDKVETDDANRQLEGYRSVISNLPKTTGMRDGKPYKLTEDEYNVKQAEFAAGLDPDNPMTEGIRSKMLIGAMDSPEKMYAREDAQKARADAAALEEIKQKALQAERLGDRAEAARLQREFLDRQYQQTMEFKVAAHNDNLDLRRDIANSRPAAAEKDPYGAPITTERGIFRVNKSTGQLEPVPYAGDTGGAAQKPLTESQASSTGYLGRMKAAEEELGKLPENAKPTVLTAALGAIPVVGEPARSIASTEKQQVQRQKQEDWVRAKLRKESGASIPTSEMDREIATYFPTPFDKPETIAAKKSSREEAQRSLQPSTGRQTAPSGGGEKWERVNGKLVRVK